MSDKYRAIIGMEVHVELASKAKMFCRCDASHFQVEPNTHVCPVCMGLPGALPVPNEDGIKGVVKIGTALGCKINRVSKFDRKHYFYPDLPKGYQISQYDQPLCYSGEVVLASGKRVRIERVHLEEDTGKLVHREVDGKKVSLVDYNRSGVPLVEIVTKPDLESAQEAKEYLKLIHATVRYLGVSDADMEKGSMRLEANISVSKDGSLPPYKVEVKNVNSFRYIATAIEYEIKRQIKLLEQGETPKQETRGWSLEGRKTVSQRSKEEAKDYRYFPEPDIPPLNLSEDMIKDWSSEIGSTPMQMRDKLVKLGVRPDYVETVIYDKKTAVDILGLVEVAIKEGLEVNKVVGRVVNKGETGFDRGEVIRDVKEEEERSFADEGTVEEWIKQAIRENEAAVADYRKGKETAVKFLMGQVMRLSKGEANPADLEDKIKAKLDE